jgi:hypothetical protein
MRVRQTVAPQGWADYSTTRAGIAEHGDNWRYASGSAQSVWPVLFKDELQSERDFVKQSGLLMAGCDPTGYCCLCSSATALQIASLTEARSATS